MSLCHKTFQKRKLQKRSKRQNEQNDELRRKPFKTAKLQK